jgi:hypothetical protein
VFYWSGFLAWGLRAAAWGKQRRKRAEKNAAGTSSQPVLQLLGMVVIVVGLIAANFGAVWRDPVEGFLMGTAFTKSLELYLPYWPFTPYLPLFVIALGTSIMTKPSVGQSATT